MCEVRSLLRVVTGDSDVIVIFLFLQYGKQAVCVRFVCVQTFCFILEVYRRLLKPCMIQKSDWSLEFH